MSNLWITIFLCTAAVMLLVTGQALVASSGADGFAGEKRMRGAAQGGIAPSGIVIYDDQGVYASWLVQVEDIMLPAGTVLEVFINGDRIGTITLTPFSIHPPLMGGTMEPTLQGGKIVRVPADPKVVFVKHGSRSILTATL